MAKAEKAKIDFDFQSDALYIRPVERKYRSSVQEDRNFILDLDDKGRISGIEILNISKILRVPKAFLRSISYGEARIEASRDRIMIEVYLNCLVRNRENTKTLIMRENNPDPECIKPGHVSLAMA